MSSNNATATTGATINATATIQQQSRLKEIGASSAQHQKNQSHNAALMRRAQRDSAASASSSSAVSSLWSQLLENVPQVRNATQFYVHDAMKGAKEAVGQLATNMQQHVSAQRQRSIDDANARGSSDHGSAPGSKMTSHGGGHVGSDIGMSRFAFVGNDAHDDNKGANNRKKTMGRRINSDDFNAHAAFGDDNENAESKNGSSASPPSAAKDGGSSDADEKRKTDGRTKAALAAASAASKATSVAAANLATGLYNILSSSSMVPEVHYNPGDAVYGSYPASVAGYFRGGPSIAPASAGGGDSSAAIPPNVASALAPYIPPFGHCPPPPSANDAYSTLSTTPPSFTVLSAAVQNVLTHNNNNNSAVTNYLSLALEDGIAIFEIDGSGVFEVIANIKGDLIMKALYLQHSIVQHGRGAAAADGAKTANSGHAIPWGAPPQPTPQRILDVKVLERHIDDKSSNAAPIIGTINLVDDNGNDNAGNDDEQDDGSSAKPRQPTAATVVTITSQSPIITYALLTDAFLHYEASTPTTTTTSEDGGTKHNNNNNSSKTVCKRHQRIMIVECVPRCVLMGGSGDGGALPSQVIAPSPSEFFVPLRRRYNSVTSATNTLPLLSSPLVGARGIDLGADSSFSSSESLLS